MWLSWQSSNDVHAIAHKMSLNESTTVEPLRSVVVDVDVVGAVVHGIVVVVHDVDDGGVVVDGLEHGRPVEFPCGLGSSRSCMKYGVCRLEP